MPQHFRYNSLRVDHESRLWLLRAYLFHKKRLIVLSLALLVIIYSLTHLYRIRDLIYIVRPLFDNGESEQFLELPHFHNSFADNAQLCAIHGWRQRSASDDKPPIRVIDAIIFSVELDLLELRLRELWDVVDVFIVLEANRTFTGQPKPLILRQNLERFAWAREKLKVEYVTNLVELGFGKGPFSNELRMRKSMTKLVKDVARDGDIIIVADVDEILRSSTVDLFRKCSGFPSPLHTRLRTYVYSFEFFFSYNDSWRAKIIVFERDTFAYDHGKASDYILADSGWHCTFCFRYLEDFRFKMTSYSHNDRLMGRTDLLTDDEIQRRICIGLDVFDMYPEVYSFKEMVQKFGAIPQTTSFIDLPRGLIENRDRFRYLLKGNCIREDYKGPYVLA